MTFFPIYFFVLNNSDADSRKFCTSRNIKGALFVATGSANGTAVAPKNSVLKLLNYLKTKPLFEGSFKGLRHKESRYNKHPSSILNLN